MLKLPDKKYRIRRGELVEIPKKWVGKITSSKTIRQRSSKLIGKVKRAISRKAQFIDAKFKHIDE